MTRGPRTTPSGSLLDDRPKGSIGNPLTEADIPFAVEVGGCYWIKLGDSPLQQLPYAPPGSTLDVEVRRGK